MENRGSIGWRGFWLLAGVVAMAVMCFGAEDGRAGEPVLLLTMAPMMAASLVPVAPCGLRLAAVCQRVWRLGCRRGAWLAGMGLGAVTVGAWLVAVLLGPVAIAIYAVVLGLPVWMAWWRLAHRG